MIFGLGILLEGWMPTSIVHKLFSFPYIFFTAALMTYLIYRSTPPKKTLTKDAKKSTSYTAILIYSGLCVLVFIYIKFNDKVFIDPAPKRKRFKNPHNAYYKVPESSKTMRYPGAFPPISIV